jgi:hypothetical protein
MISEALLKRERAWDQGAGDEIATSKLVRRQTATHQEGEGKPRE